MKRINKDYDYDHMYIFNISEDYLYLTDKINSFELIDSKYYYFLDKYKNLIKINKDSFIKFMSPDGFQKNRDLNIPNIKELIKGLKILLIKEKLNDQTTN